MHVATNTYTRVPERTYARTSVAQQLAIANAAVLAEVTAQRDYFRDELERSTEEHSVTEAELLRMLIEAGPPQREVHWPWASRRSRRGMVAV